MTTIVRESASQYHLVKRIYSQALSAGDTVILYLDSMSAKIVPETGLTGTLYGPVSFDNGVFDVTVTGPIGAVVTVNDDTKVHPRGVTRRCLPKALSLRLRTSGRP